MSKILIWPDNQATRVAVEQLVEEIIAVDPDFESRQVVMKHYRVPQNPALTVIAIWIGLEVSKVII
jgi:hypothetical protein